MSRVTIIAAVALLLVAAGFLGNRIGASQVSTFTVSEEIRLPTGEMEKHNYFCIQRFGALWCEKIAC